jgi:plastocyanin
MMRWLRLVGAVFALGLLFSACSDDSGDDTAGGSSDTAADGSTTDSGGGGTDVTIADFAFDPDGLTVSVGDTVTWTNDDDTDHTVTADDDSFDSDDISGGDTFEQTFDEAGEFTYHCSIHSQMTGTVTVE